ncbi:MAG: hypothetical protein ACK56I_10060, partial [bacterium]
MRPVNQVDPAVCVDVHEEPRVSVPRERQPVADHAAPRPAREPHPHGEAVRVLVDQVVPDVVQRCARRREVPHGSVARPGRIGSTEAIQRGASIAMEEVRQTVAVEVHHRRRRVLAGTVIANANPRGKHEGRIPNAREDAGAGCVGVASAHGCRGRCAGPLTP